MYTMELKTNLFLITMSGFMTQEESILYIEELNKNIKNISPIEYNIVVDLRKLKNSSQELVWGREQSILLINSTPFKKRYIIMQGKKVSTVNDEFNDPVFAESYGELLKLTA